VNALPKKRNLAADLLKGTAVILMIQVHLMELFATESIYNSLTGRISLFLGGPPAAPVFMIVMGYFIARSPSSLKRSIFRGFKLIGLGFLLNTGLNLHLLIRIASGAIEANPWHYIFGVDILFLAGISIIVMAVLKQWFGLKPLPYVIVILLIFIVQHLIPQADTGTAKAYFLAYFTGNGIWWSYFPAVPWIVYPLTGLLFKVVEKNSGSLIYKYKWYIFAVTAIISAVFFSYGLRISSNLELYYNHGFTFYLFTLVFLIFWSIPFVWLAGWTENPALRFTEWIGRNVTAAYVIQWLIIGNIATGIYRTQNLYQLIFWFVLIIALTSGGVWFWNRIKLKRKKAVVSFD
jgi:uncharacterized membrane protein